MKRSGVVLWSILLLSAEGAAQKFPEYPVQSASQYSSCQTKSGIRVAIEPVGEGDKQKKYFGAKFGSQGFLPVLVVLENASEGSSVLLRRDLVTYGIGDNQSKSSAGDVSAKSKTGQTVAVAGAVAFLPAMFIGAMMIVRATEVKQNILVKELRSQTIAPGKWVQTVEGNAQEKTGNIVTAGSHRRKMLESVKKDLADKSAQAMRQSPEFQKLAQKAR